MGHHNPTPRSRRPGPGLFGTARANRSSTSHEGIEPGEGITEVDHGSMGLHHRGSDIRTTKDLFHVGKRDIALNEPGRAGVANGRLVRIASNARPISSVSENTSANVVGQFNE